MSSTSSSRCEHFGQPGGIARERVSLGLRQSAALDAVGERRGVSRVFSLLDKDRAPRRVPRRDLVSPPELARNAPRLDVLEPIEVGLLPGLGDELGLAFAHRGDRRLGERLGVGVPLVREPGLDDHVRAVAVRNCVRVRFDFREKTGERHHLDDPAPRDEAVLAIDRGDQPGMIVVALEALEEIDIALERHSPLGVENIDRTHTLGLMPLADFEIVEVVRGRDLDRARALLRIRIFVSDNRDQAADQRQANALADQMLIARVVRMHRDRRVAQHRFGPGRGDGKPFAGLFTLRVHDRIFEVVEVAVGVFGQDLGERRRVERRAVVTGPLESALGLDLHHLQVRDRGLELRVPVDEALVLVDEPLAIELHEHLGDRARQALVERKALAAPVAGSAEALELGHDRPARFRLPRPDALDERLASQGAAVRLLPLHEHAFDHHLRGDAGMVHAWLPQHVAAVHAPVAAQDVLKRVVERVAHMKIAGDVRRRNDNAKRLRFRPVGATGPEGACLLPKRGGAAFCGSEVERFVHHGFLVCDPVGDARDQMAAFRAAPATDAAGASATSAIKASSRSKSTRDASREAISARARSSEFHPGPAARPSSGGCRPAIP